MWFLFLKIQIHHKGVGKWEESEHRIFLRNKEIFGNDWCSHAKVMLTKTCSQVIIILSLLLLYTL